MGSINSMMTMSPAFTPSIEGIGGAHRELVGRIALEPQGAAEHLAADEGEPPAAHLVALGRHHARADRFEAQGGDATRLAGLAHAGHLGREAPQRGSTASWPATACCASSRAAAMAEARAPARIHVVSNIAVPCLHSKKPAMLSTRRARARDRDASRSTSACDENTRLSCRDASVGEGLGQGPRCDSCAHLRRTF